MSELYMNLGQSISPEIMDIVQKMQGPPIAPAQQPQPQQVEAPNPEPVSQKVAATRITPDELARDIIGRSAEQYSNLLNNTSDDVYQSAYQIARQSGSTMDEARQFAREKASFHQNQRVNALSQAFLHGGLDADGTITRQGVGILAQLAQENPQQVNMLGNMFQSPQNALKYQQDIAKTTLNNNLHLRNAKEMAGVNFDYSQRGADAQMARNRQLAIERANHAANAATAQAYLDAIGQGATPEQAQRYAAEQGQIAYYSSLSGYSTGGGRGGNGRGNGNGSGRNGGNNNGTVGSSEAWKAYERATEKFNEAQAMLEPGQPNPMAALYQNALYNYFGNIDPSNPRNLAAWKEYFRVVEGMSGEDFDAWIKSRVKQQETVDKNQRLEVNGSHNDEDDEMEEEASEDENTTDAEETKENQEQYNPSLDNSVVAKINGMTDVDDGSSDEDIRANELDKRVQNIVRLLTYNPNA